MLTFPQLLLAATLLLLCLASTLVFAAIALKLEQIQIARLVLELGVLPLERAGQTLLVCEAVGLLLAML